MNNSEWCVIFAINDKVQNFTTCYNTTENAVYEYCREEADGYSEESGRSLFNTQILDPEQKMVEMYIGKTTTVGYILCMILKQILVI